MPISPLRPTTVALTAVSTLAATATVSAVVEVRTPAPNTVVHPGNTNFLISADNGGGDFNVISVLVNTFPAFQNWRALPVGGFSSQAIMGSGGGDDPFYPRLPNPPGQVGPSLNPNSYANFLAIYNGVTYGTNNDFAPDTVNPQYLGFQFVGLNPADRHYGWIELLWSAAPRGFQIVRWAFETEPNTAIPYPAMLPPPPPAGAGTGTGIHQRNDAYRHMQAQQAVQRKVAERMRLQAARRAAQR